jgi:hypothetical protein
VTSERLVGQRGGCRTLLEYGPHEPPLDEVRKASDQGGGDGTRTRNPLLAKQVRCQLRHAPQMRPGRPQGTGSWRRPANQLTRGRPVLLAGLGQPCEVQDLLDRVGDLGPEFLLGLVGLHLAPHGEPGGSSGRSSDDLLHDDSSSAVVMRQIARNRDLRTVPNWG